MEALHFYICFLLIICSYFAAFSINPINAVISLIITFCNASILLFFFNIEFLGTVFIIIYVGAIAVLFLFVIMMLNIKTNSFNFLKQNAIKILFLFILYHICIYTLVIFYGNVFSSEKYYLINNSLNLYSFLDTLNNIDIIGQVIFNYITICFLIAGLILLVSLIGSIVLTLEFKNRPDFTSKQLSKGALSIRLKKKLK